MFGEDYGDLVGRIYDAALDHELWPGVLDELRRMVDCRTGVLLHGTLNPVVLTVKGASGLDARAVERVQEVFGDPANNPFTRKLPSLRVGMPVPRQAFIDDETFENHPIHRTFLEPLGLFHDITTPVTVSPDEAVTLFLGRGRPEGPLGEREAKILLPWIPHLQRALLIDRQLRMNSAGSHALVEILDRLNCGVVLTAACGSVLLANAAAESIAAAGDGLVLRGRQLLAQARRDNEELGRAIDMAVAGQGGAGLLVQRPSGARPYLVFTVPLSRSVASNWPQGPAVAILFSDPEGSAEPPPDILAQLYGLSPAEARVAAEAARGLGLDAVATKLGISRNTAKTHLNRVFEKTGTSRQAELVRVLLVGSAGIVRKRDG